MLPQLSASQVNDLCTVNYSDFTKQIIIAERILYTAKFFSSQTIENIRNDTAINKDTISKILNSYIASTASSHGNYRSSMYFAIAQCLGIDVDVIWCDRTYCITDYPDLQKIPIFASKLTSKNCEQFSVNYACTAATDSFVIDLQSVKEALFKKNDISFCRFVTCVYALNGSLSFRAHCKLPNFSSICFEDDEIRIILGS